ncbi:MAG: multiprotein-bridging factor 1 family protein [Limisphaerales bacterium]
MNETQHNEKKASPFQALVAHIKETSERLTGEAVVEFRNAVLRNMKVSGVSRLELAHRMAVHPSYITKVMKGDMNISIETVAKICHALDCEFNITMDQKPLAAEPGFEVVQKSVTENNVQAGEGDGAPALFSFYNLLEEELMGESRGLCFSHFEHTEVRGIRPSRFASLALLQS